MSQHNQSPLLRTARHAASVVATAALLASLTGCGAVANLIPGAGGTPQPKVYGSVLGSGQSVKTADGSYERITVDPLLMGEDPSMDGTEPGWTSAQKFEARKLAMQYVAEEHLDSIVLEGGLAAVPEWKATAGKKYLVSTSVFTGDGAGVLGNTDGHNVIPAMIHDGKPRVTLMTVNPVYTGSIDNEGVQRLTYNVDYNADYRINDASAAHLGGLEYDMNGEQFIASDKAKEVLKDGQGENALGLYGNVELQMAVDTDGVVRISSTHFNVKFDTSAFSSGAFAPRAK